MHPVGAPDGAEGCGAEAAVVGDLDVSERYGVASLPATLLIDRNGKVAAKHFGVVDKAGFENEIRKLLRERPKKTVKQNPGALISFVR